MSPLDCWQDKTKSIARLMACPYGPWSGWCPRDKKASTHKLVTAGCPCCNVGNDPSAACCAANQVSALSTDFSICCHFARDTTAANGLDGALLVACPVLISFSAVCPAGTAPSKR